VTVEISRGLDRVGGQDCVIKCVVLLFQMMV